MAELAEALRIPQGLQRGGDARVQPLAFGGVEVAVDRLAQQHVVEAPPARLALGDQTGARRLAERGV
jgi:hypothetical protein